MAESDQSKLVFEGPILISTTAIEGPEVMSHLRLKIFESIKEGHLENAESARVLILSGSHGEEDGHSGLTEINRLKDPNDTYEGSVTTTFYENDCQRVGLRSIKPRLDIKELPLNKDTIPDIMKKLNKLNPMFFQNSFLCDDSISKMTFQVTNIAYYHKNEDKLVDDILRFLIRVVNYPF